MTTTTFATERRAAWTGRTALVLLLALMGMITGATSARATSPIAPVVPTDIAVVAPTLKPLKPHLVLTPRCDPAGLAYKVVVPNAGPGTLYLTQWRKAPNGAVKPLGVAQAGFVQSGTGHFQVRSTVIFQGQRVATIGWTDVTVKCAEPKVGIDAHPRCDAEPGFSYTIHVAHPPKGDLTYEAQWRRVGGALHSVEGAGGSIASGEGDFQVRAVVHTTGTTFYRSAFVDVTVDCPDEPGTTDPDPEPEPDQPRPATPTFTG
jgi:hypothetical protein